MTIAIGEPAPDFSLRTIDGEMMSLEDLRGRRSLVVFIPFPFSGNCGTELCSIRDRIEHLSELDANVVAITTDTVFANRAWSEANDFGFPILSDFWPHGAVTSAYGVFDERTGSSNRATFVLDGEGIVRAIVATESRRDVRDFGDYVAALDAI